MQPFRNPMTGRLAHESDYYTSNYRLKIMDMELQQSMMNTLYQSQWDSLSQPTRQQFISALYNAPAQKTDEQIKAEKDKADKDRLYAEMADPCSPLYDPLLCLKNGVNYKKPSR